MKKLLSGIAVGLCTLPAIAAAASHTALTSEHALAAKAPATSSLPNLPLPPLQAESSLSLAGFGKGAAPTTKVIALPGLGSITRTNDNPGKGNGQATYTRQLNIDPTSTQTPTNVAADFSVPQKGQVAANYTLQGAGFGKASNPALKQVSLPLGGTLTPSYDNQGKGEPLNASLDYLSPAPKN